VLARHAARGERPRKNRRTETARGRGRAAEKTAFRAYANYASYAITMQKSEKERERERREKLGTREDAPLKESNSSSNVRSVHDSN